MRHPFVRVVSVMTPFIFLVSVHGAPQPRARSARSARGLQTAANAIPVPGPHQLARPPRNGMVLIGYRGPEDGRGNRIDLAGGWSPQPGWVSPPPDGLGPEWKASTWQLLSLSEPASISVRSRPTPEASEGEDGPGYVSTRPLPPGVLLSRASNPRPREVLPLMPDRPRVLRTTQELLAAEGIPVPARPRILEAYRVDLSSKGSGELLWTARSRDAWSSPYEEGPGHALPGDYALLGLQYGASEGVRAVALAVAKAGDDCTRYHLYPPLDLNGDGQMEILADDRGFEEERLLAFTFDGTRPAGILGTPLPARTAAAVARWAKPVPFPRQRLYPVDEGVKDSSLRAFRRELLRAVRRRDSRFVLSHLDPHVVTNPFGEQPMTGIQGIKEFKTEWHPEDPKSQLWPELIKILALGGSFKRGEVLHEGMAPAGREFVAPYVASRWPDSLDADRYWAIIGKNVPVRRRPDAAAPMVDVVAYDMVKVGLKESLGATDGRWVKITTSRGKQGYVTRDQVGSAEDTEAHFAKKHGKWVMTGLFATFGE